MKTIRVTMRQIGEAAGVHFTTVSRALSNHAGIPIANRQRIKKLAQEMGYVPDPMVSALNAYRVSKREAVFHGKIAWLDTHPRPEVSSKTDVHRRSLAGAKLRAREMEYESRLLAGARLRAREIGYEIETFSAGSGRPALRQLEKNWAARGIRNLIVSPLYRSRAHLGLAWEKYSAVSVSFSLSYPQLHLVTHDQFGNAVILMRNLRALGYRRIGLVLSRDLINRTDQRWLAGYLVERERLPSKRRLAPFEFPSGPVGPSLRAWYKHNRPDVIVTIQDMWEGLIREALGLNTPEDIGVAILSLKQDSVYGGVLENAECVGSCAVEQLARMEHASERGVPHVCQRIMIQGSWRGGATVQRKNR